MRVLQHGASFRSSARTAAIALSCTAALSACSDTVTRLPAPGVGNAGATPPSAEAARSPDTRDGVQAPTSAAPQILVFTRTAGYRHASIPDAVATLRALGDAEAVAVTHREDPGVFSDAGLARFAVVVFANTTGEVLDAAQRAAFARHVGSGAGFIGVHSAADSEYGDPWYGALVGARFLGHPPGLQRARVAFAPGQGPEDARSWHMLDELYDYRRAPGSDVTLVATLHDRDDGGGAMGDHHPIAWCHARLGGRAWYTGLGHDPAIYADPVFRDHLARGLRYVLRRSARC